MAIAREFADAHLLREAQGLLDDSQRSKLMLRTQVEPNFLSRMYGELMRKVLRRKEAKTAERLKAFIV